MRYPATQEEAVMSFISKLLYGKKETTNWPIPNSWDLMGVVLVFATIVLLFFGTRAMTSPFELGQQLPITLEPHALPYYALRTVIRMFIGLFFSLIFTFTVGTLAGKNKASEKLIIPAIDVLQSVPVLSFLSITVTAFIALFRGSMLGPECAAIFAIFVSQVWNMTLSFYHSMRRVPRNLKETSRIFRLSGWQSFWRIDVPFAMPGLLWNMMVSMSGSWFFVTASEAFSVANHKITLPGLGSYIALAIIKADTHAILLAILTMLIVIFLYDQIIFRPLGVWVEKFKFGEMEDSSNEESWVVNLFQRTKILSKATVIFDHFSELFINLPFIPKRLHKISSKAISSFSPKLRKILYITFISLSSILALFYLGKFAIENITFDQIRHAAYLGLFTALRIMILIVIVSVIWVPIGVWIGLRPKLARKLQPVIQFISAFPANLLFPIMALLIITYNLNVEIWSSPLMVLGTQWYILFNVIAGTMAIPKDLKQTTSTFGVKGFLRWRKLILPAIFPYYVNGAIAASGGAWNASIIAEIINWGRIHLKATGLGAYITEATANGRFTEVILGTVIMCTFVLIIDRIFWRPLFNVAVEKFSLGD